MAVSLDRRSLLRSGAVAAGAFALGGGVSGEPIAARAETAGAVTPPISGRLIAWLTIYPERVARLRLAELDEHAQMVRELDAATLPAGSIEATAAEAHSRSVAAVARAWDVPQAECVIGHRRIGHPASGRSVPYAVWVDVV